MGDNAGELVVELSGKDVNLTAFLTRMEAQLVKSEAAGVRAGKGIGDGIGQGATKAANSSLALAQAQARLEVAEGNTAQAANTLRNALAGQDSTTVQVINAKRQLIAVEKQLENAQNGTAASSKNLSSALSGIGGALVAGGLVIGLQQIVSMGQELVTVGAQAGRVRSAFDELAKAGGTSGNALINSLRAASRGEISDLNLELAANRANLLGVAKSAEELAKLLDIARDRAKKMGTETGQAFNDLVTGLGRGSPLILDNLGITVKLGEANEAYAKTLGKTSAQLTDTEKKQALINAVLQQSVPAAKGAETAVDKQAAALDRAKASWDNFKVAAGQAALQFVAPAAEGAAQLLTMKQRVDALGPSVLQAATSWDQYRAKVASTGELLGSITNQKLAALSQAQFNYAQSLIKTGVSADEAFAKAQALNGAFVEIGAVQARFTQENLGTAQSLDALSNQMLRVADSGAAGAAFVQGLVQMFLAGKLSAEQMVIALQQNEAGQLAVAAASQTTTTTLTVEQQAAQEAATAFAAHSKELDDNAAKASIAAVESEALKVKQDALAFAAQQAAGAVLAAGGDIAATAGRLAASSSQVDVLTAAYLRLAQAQQAATKQKLATVPLGKSDSDEIRGQQRNDRLAAAAASRAEAARRAAIDRDLAYQRASNAEKLKMTNAQLANTKAYSDEWVKLQKQKDTLTQGLDKKSAAAGKAAGAVKVSDQQKLNNTLITDQEKADDKFEDAENEHLKRMLEIQKDYDEKAKAAQRDFDQDRLDGSASFYDNLGSIESDKIRQAASAAYEAAALEAGKIAEEKGADVADKYMSAQEKIISDRAKRQADIEKAVKDKDGSKAEYLQGVDAKYRQAEEARLARIKEGEGSIASEKDRALQDELSKNEEAQGKIALSAEQSAARKIAAAERAGKKIDEEQVKVDKLAQSYDKVAATGSGGTADRAATTQAPAAPAQQSGGEVGKVLEALQASLDSVKAAIENSGLGIQDATSKAGEKVAGAVKNIKTSTSSGGIS